jgi:hypothetical protein
MRKGAASTRGRRSDYIRESICPRMALEETVRQGSTEWMKKYSG